MEPSSNETTQPGPVPRIVKLAMEAAERLGMSSRILDPDYGYLFEVRHGQQVLRLVGGLSPLNSAVSARLAQDKAYSEMLLREAGFRVPGSVRCFRSGYFKHLETEPAPGLDQARQFARRHGFPLIVKPNRMALGRGVRRVDDIEQLRQAVIDVWQADYIALVQPVVEGADLRLDFVGDQYIVGYMRKPITIYGDGKHTIRELLQILDPRFAEQRYWNKRYGDHVWQRVVASRGLDERSVLEPHARLHFGQTVLNLNQWATAERIDELPAPWLAFCRAVGKAMRLEHYGLDLRVPKLESAHQMGDVDPYEAVIIEVNASPSLVQIRQLGWEEQAMKGQMLVLRRAFGLD